MRLNSDQISLRIGAAVLALLGALLIWGAWALNAETRLFTDHGVRTRGITLEYTAVDSHSKENGTTTSYYPKIQFTDRGGLVRRFESNLAQDPLENPVGDPVDVIYLPENPDNARIDTWANLGGESVIWSVVGAVLIGFGALIWFVFAADREFPAALMFPLAFGLFAALFGVIAWVVSLDSVSLVARGQRTEAVVVSDQGPALVEYTANGKPYRNQTRVQDEKHPLGRGDKVMVLYDPAKPGRARVESFDQLWFPSALTGGFAVLLGLCSVGTGVWFFVNRRRPRGRPPQNPAQ